MGMINLLVLAGLLALPVYAGYRLEPSLHWLGVCALLVSGITYWVYAVDKRRAEEGLWRVPESNLHLLELLGGWPGAFLAQRRLRHKCSKGNYQFVFWLIVLGYQFAAYDSFHNWQYSRAGVNYIEQTLHRRR
jgi:uncharacterized membrane protein YsdA (DUF1294 family)